MEKCVGPCDGTISLGAYRQLIAFSAKVLADPQDYAREQTRRMQQAAAELRFEAAQKIKAYADEFNQLGKGSLRHVRPLREFTFITLQRGPRAGTAKVFLITPGRIEEIAGLIREPTSPGEVLKLALVAAHDRRDDPLDEIGAERIGVVAHHLFQPKAKQGVFLPLAHIDERSFVKAYRDLQNQKPQDDTPGEGVTKELQAL
jgi:excinuclease UvrABC nuclease subunit